MNIAFTTILIFIILTPGYLARRAYKSSKLSVSNLNKNAVNELTWSIIPALSIHLLFVLIIECVSDYYIDFTQIGELVLGRSNISSFEKIGDYKLEIFFYNLSVFASSFLSGYLLREIVRKTRLDIKIRYFRFTNKWHYIFTGECLDFPDVPDSYSEITDKVINILCSVNGKNIIYTGVFFNYYIDSNGNLEAIHLRNPIRRYLDNDSSLPDKYYTIQSRYLVIPNSDIININFRYLSLEEVDENSLLENQINNAIEFNEEQTE